MQTGEDVRIHKTAELTHSDNIIGNHVSIDMGVYISSQIDIGDYVHIAPHVCIIGGGNSFLGMGHFTNIGAGSKIVVVSDDFTHGMINPIVPLRYRHIIGGVIRMEMFAAIGVNSVVLPGCWMAEGSVLGANSLLTKRTEPWDIYVGSPAKRIGTRDSKWIFESAKELGYDV